MADLDIYRKEKKVGEIKEGKIFSKDKTLNAMLSFLNNKGQKAIVNRASGGGHSLAFSSNPEDFYEYLLQNGFVLVNKN